MDLTHDQTQPYIHPTLGSADPTPPTSPPLTRTGGLEEDQYTPNTPNFPSDRDGITEVPLLPSRPFIDKGSINGDDMRREPKAQYLSLKDAVYDNTQPEFDPKYLHYDVSPPRDKSSSKTLPSPALFPRGLPKPFTKHPFAQGFEAPNWTQLLVHVGLCLVAYPFLMIFIVIARAKPLFWTRFVVSLGCGLIGFCLGFSLLQLGKKFLEAATWATVIHQSRVMDEPGVKLKDLAANSGDSTSALAALRLLWDRYMYTGTSRRSRQQYDRRPWSLFIGFFLLIIAVAASLPFVLGRIVVIDTSVIHQRVEYAEVPVKGASSGVDIARAALLRPFFESFLLTWTLSPSSENGGLPPVVTFDYHGDTVYFSEIILSQLLPNGSGFGTFDTIPPIPTPPSKEKETQVDAAKVVDPGWTLRFPRWGIRTRCAKIPSGQGNIFTYAPSGLTYVFTPRKTLHSLFDSYHMDYPGVLQPFNATTVMQGNDTLPPNLVPDDLALGGYFFSNGVTHSFRSMPLTMGHEGRGWASIEHVLIRLNTTYAPNGNFDQFSSTLPDQNGNPTYVGYDAAVCLELFEPWIVEVFNSTTGFPRSTELIGPGNELFDFSFGKKPEKMIAPPLTDPNIIRQLNSSKMADVYLAAHENSINRMVKDNGRDSWYVPSPTVVGYTDGEGPMGYTELSASRFAHARGLADASNVLPYLVGSGDLVTRCYPDQVLSSARIYPLHMCIYLLLVLLLGLVAGFFVPKLPLDIPHRGFELYSWMAAFHADELVGEGREVGITRNMELDEIAGQMGDLRFRYVNNSN
ncbi:hypothetical protein BDZ94DRAFT_1289419 [Collybia nuda]|uniref:Uncharacterized protein n=1 Tax=Collybia nuda TaxID=64659 RepID=A0A9P5Y8K4_9AGAR|nr:hypothetical protein BDZ94DRAFT_1289419 [Collybia nuda]